MEIIPLKFTLQQHLDILNATGEQVSAILEINTLCESPAALREEIVPPLERMLKATQKISAIQAEINVQNGVGATAK